MRTILAALALAATFCSLQAAHAAGDAYPNKPIKVVVGFPPGAGNDILARLVGQKLSERLGQPVVIDNKPGASAIIAAGIVAHAAPDGYTLMVAPIGAITVNPVVYTKLPYAPSDFVAISMIASFPLVLVVNPATPVKSVADLVAYAKANPTSANIGGSGVGFQLVDALFKMRTGAPVVYVRYKSSTEAVTALAGGEILMSIVDTGPVSGPLKGGQVKAIAVTSKARLPFLPDVPTMTEAGLPDLSADFWSGLFAPSGTPPDIVAKLQDETIRVVKSPEIRDRMAALQVTPEGTTSADFSRRIKREIEQWSDVAKANNIKIEE
ncbi:MAG TPA: tripartite tricarboxylate transporter substrate binding protein [Alphaproteobacteria bacterium]|nr:tripartite tricarboxylate transporter substrate binding protein [Alphaproteobacteria bacterium]